MDIPNNGNGDRSPLPLQQNKQHSVDIFKLKKKKKSSPCNNNNNNNNNLHQSFNNNNNNKKCQSNGEEKKYTFFQKVGLFFQGVLNDFLMPNPKCFKKTSIYRRARLLTYLCIIYFLIFAIGLAMFDPLYPIFIFSVVAMFAIYVLAMRSIRFTMTCLLYTIIQMIIYIAICVVYFTRLNAQKQESLIFYHYFNLFDLVGVLVTSTILFPSFWFCGSILLVINLLNCALNLFIHYYLIVSQSMIFQNIIISVATSCLLLFYSYITSVDLKEIEEREERIRSLFNLSSEALVIHKNGIIVDANSTFENMFQVKLDSILHPVAAAIGEFLPNIEQYLNKSMIDIHDQASFSLLDNKKIIETVAINSSGEEFSVEVRSQKKEFLSNPVDILSIIDTSARRKLMEADTALRKAEAVNEAKINFLTNVSHEVRTPINGILASVDILEKTNLDNTQGDFLVCVKDSANYLLDLITDILDFSKIESGKMQLQPVEFNMITMLEETMNIVYSTTKERGLELILFVDPAIPIIVVADHYRIKQILLNFLSNAIKFTSTGQVVIRVNFVSCTPSVANPSSTEFKISFEVEDSGIGLRQEQIEKLFTAFLQFDNHGSRNFQGTGLGLSISKKLCNMMGGEITVKSTYGSGSTFGFSCNVLSASDSWTYGSLSSSLSLRSDNHAMIHTNNDKFSCSKIKGFVVYNNDQLRKSAVQLFTAIRLHWILISENTPDYLDPFFSSILKMPLHLPTVVESLYFIQKVPIPLDLYFLLTNFKASKNDSLRSSHDKDSKATCTSLSSSSTNNTYSSSLTSNPSSTSFAMDDYKTAERRRHLTHQRNSSYSDHVAITRGLVQVNRSPRTNSDKTNEPPVTIIDLSGKESTSVGHHQLLHHSNQNNNSNSNYSSSLPPIYIKPAENHRINLQQPPTSHHHNLNHNNHLNSSNQTTPLSFSPPPPPPPITAATTTQSSNLSNNVGHGNDDLEMNNNNSSSSSGGGDGNSHSSSNSTSPITSPPFTSSSSPPTINVSTSQPTQPQQPVLKEQRLSLQSTPRRNNSNLNEETIGDSRSLSYSSFTSNVSIPSPLESTPSMNGVPVSPFIQSQPQSPYQPQHHQKSSSQPSSPIVINNDNNCNILQLPGVVGQRSPILSPHLTTLSRRVSIPQLDLDSQKQEFHRKSRSTLTGSNSTINESPRLTKPFKILLVEDNLVNCKVFTKFLRDGGHSVSHACNGIEAINAIKSDYYPIILMDCQMPLMGGIEATRVIRKYEKDNYSSDKRYKKCFIIALTANEISEREECFAAGMNDFIQKPVRGSLLLLSAIEKYIKNFSDEDLQYLSSIKK
ncbi:histidine kinase [Cavenderia fasciculata]|uniref:Histidine kinase n=1 Tax=Cavenderia fasciculata TaxID=261658 RepID=F4Q5Z7_CACFS|nr:histidine kinase [Cavenderia fasciculata]EGG17406.1 histidine kinase [Cavenderia fasciculata]|eukprot:XP_004355890.1 histidine kinase [Cavenderia fasciculata]